MLDSHNRSRAILATHPPTTISCSIWRQRADRCSLEGCRLNAQTLRGTETAQFADLYAYSGDVDKAYEWLEIALEVRDAGLIVIRFNPILENARADPRWPEFEKKVFGR